MSNLKRNTPKHLTEKNLWDSPPLEANDSRRKPNLKPRERTGSSNAIGCPPSSGDEPSLGKSQAERIQYWEHLSAMYFIPEDRLQAKINEIKNEKNK